ncbi:MAG TPA: ABC transporter ATP-binding protein [bacterium]|nr:ABC transporter ATP-binding protein [bacterium]
MRNEAVTLKDLRFGYGKREIIKGISLSIGKGEFVGIIGPNGSGKSTLIKMMTGFVNPDHGEVLLCDKPLHKIGRRKAARLAAAVPQEMVFHFPYKVGEFVKMGRHPYQGLTETENETDRRIVKDAMKATNTLSLKGRSVAQLSGGEKQRVVLASALAQDTQLLFLDEPTSSLDIHYQIEIYEILKKMNEEKGLTIAAVTHDLNLGSLYCDRLVLLVGGKIVADGPPDRIVNPATIREHFNVEVEGGIRAITKAPYVVATGRKKL